MIAMLRCFECARNETVEESVAICIMCGKGLCMGHAHRIDLPIWEGGYPAPVRILKKVSRDLYAVIAGIYFYPAPVNKKSCTK